MKKIIALSSALLMAILIVFVLPVYWPESLEAKEDYPASSILEQQVVGVSEEEIKYDKIYLKGKLIGVISDRSRIDEALAIEYRKYADRFPDSELGLIEDVYISEEYTYTRYEDIDDKIISYLIDEKLLGVKATAVQFSTKEGVFDIIYVQNIDQFIRVRNQFLLNFVSQETIDLLSNKVAIEDPDSYGTVETNIRIEETMTYSEMIVSPEKVFMEDADIYEYLCYGRNEDRQYYLTQEGDTIQGVGFYSGDLSAKQVVMLNKDVLQDENQVIAPGTRLNVAYFTSPLTIEVTKHTLNAEVIYPEAPEYQKDDTLAAGVTKIISNEANGSKNVLYEETWINGVLQDAEVLSSYVTLEPVRGVIALGTKSQGIVGTGNFIWPVDNVHISCEWGCYPGHTGLDIQNIYNRWGVIYATDSGVVYKSEFGRIDGWFVEIDHGNGIISHYGHMNTQPYVSVGESVTRGQVIGQIGMTGFATGPHVHFHFVIDKQIVNVCTIMDCDAIRGR